MQESHRLTTGNVSLSLAVAPSYPRINKRQERLPRLVESNPPPIRPPTTQKNHRTLMQRFDSDGWKVLLIPTGDSCQQTEPAVRCVATWGGLVVIRLEDGSNR